MYLFIYTDDTYEESVQTSWDNRNSREYTIFKYKYSIYLGDHFEVNNKIIKKINSKAVFNYKIKKVRRLRILMYPLVLHVL